ncbi:MAG: cysteine desulfurase [Deltaproteobacteria bacterium]|nr:cysteine desulfurase [Deltaproteobacteria bacterium]
MLPCSLERLNELTVNVMGNSASAHRRGRQAEEVENECREAIGRLFNVPPTHVIFTSGGTESNNLAIWGALGGLTQAFHWLKNNGQGKILTSTVEHAATGKVVEALECMGAPVGWIGVDKEGLLDLNQLEQELTTRTKLLSIHHAQNEMGALQDLRAISKLVRSKQPDALIHADAVQSFMKIPLDMEDLGVDLVSVSGHKFGGPKGIGALVLGRRFETRNPKIGNLIHGSAQQHGLRPGTVPVPAIGAFVAAAEWGQRNLGECQRQLLTLRERLTSQLPSLAVVNGPSDLSPNNPRRAPQTINFSLPGLPSAVAVEALSARGYCVSSGAACHSTNPKPNETIMQMGLGRERALSAIRASFSAQNTTAEVDEFVKVLNEVIAQYA